MPFETDGIVHPPSSFDFALNSAWVKVFFATICAPPTNPPCESVTVPVSFPVVVACPGTLWATSDRTMRSKARRLENRNFIESSSMPGARHDFVKVSKCENDARKRFPSARPDFFRRLSYDPEKVAPWPSQV